MKIYTLHSVAENGLSLPPRLLRRFLADVTRRRKIIEPEAFGENCNDEATLITFDDCFSDNFANALPILAEFGIRAIFFFTPGFVQKVRWGSAALGRWSEQRQESFSIPFSYMNLSEIHALRELGHTVGFHTRTHPNLTDCDAGQLRDEILVAKAEWEVRLGFRFDHFAYPRGRCGETMFPICEEAGYKFAFTTQPREITPLDIAQHRYRLPRLPVVRKGLFGWL